MTKLFLFLKRELFEILPAAIFFFLVLHIVAFLHGLMSGKHGLTLLFSMAATIGALTIAKAILIADTLPLFNWFSRIKLIYNIIWRTLVYTFIALLFQFIEELIPLINKYGGFLAGSEHLFETIDWPTFWATHIVIILFVAIYTTFSEIVDVLGKDKFVAMLLSPKNERPADAEHNGQ